VGVLLTINRSFFLKRKLSYGKLEQAVSSRTNVLEALTRRFRAPQQSIKSQVGRKSPAEEHPKITPSIPLYIQCLPAGRLGGLRVRGRKDGSSGKGQKVCHAVLENRHTRAVLYKQETGSGTRI